MVSTATRRAAGTAVALLVLCAALVRDATLPPTPAPATAPAAEFSAERALVHVRQIAQRPHPSGSPDNARVREYLLAQLRALGLEPQVQEATGVGTRYPSAGRIRNVMARLRGKTPGGQAVVLMSHYDGVGGGAAAGDAGAATGAVLETMRALRAGPQLTHDVIALITDGEEAGLLGAAAFVREHPWAKDVGATLNFEARGTTGRSRMFETGPGNLDVARVLRAARDVSATSLSVTVYRSLPNDTDLSEMAVLGKPALNFAFADGVERYHTAHDDVAHLNPGSVQHHGAQMLALARAFGNGPFPRPATGDAVFFDLPLAGLIVYPETWVWPITLVGIGLLIASVLRGVHSGRASPSAIAIGAVGTVVSTAVAGGVVMLVASAIARVHVSTGWHGEPSFRGLYTAALGLVALSTALVVWALVRRWASAAGAHLGALVVWGLITLLVTWKLPGVSFLFVWPLIAGTVGAWAGARAVGGAPPGLTPSRGETARVWIGTVVAAAIVIPIAYAVSAVLLGAVGPGGIAAGVLVSLLAWLLAPQMEALAATKPWRAAGIATVATVAVVAAGMATVRASPRHPTPSLIVYALDADNAGAWLVARGPVALVASPSRPEAEAPAWMQRAFGTGPSVTYHPAPRLPVDAPGVTVISDSSTNDERRLVLRVRAAPGTETVNIRASDGRVLAAAVDGRAIDTTRYRRRLPVWSLTYAAPPDSGITLALTVPARTGVSLELTARRPLREVPAGVALRERPAHVVTVQTGDITVVRRAVRIE